MYCHPINPTGKSQSTCNVSVTSDLDAAVIEVVRGFRVYVLLHERNARGEPVDYWYGRVVVAVGESVQLLGILPHYYPSPEAAYQALRTMYPEPLTDEGERQ